MTNLGLIVAIGSAIILSAGHAKAQESSTQPSDSTIYFDLGKAQLTKPSRTVVLAAAQLAVATGAKKIKIVGHADSSGPAEYNLWLSMKRTNAVVHELIKDGVHPSVIEADWRGEFEPAVDDGDNVKNQANRRVTITVQ